MHPVVKFIQYVSNFDQQMLLNKIAEKLSIGFEKTGNRQTDIQTNGQTVGQILTKTYCSYCLGGSNNNDKIQN